MKQERKREKEEYKGKIKGKELGIYETKWEE